ncbi:MAG: MaoC family dehydratase [Chloroflexota bacterium]
MADTLHGITAGKTVTFTHTFSKEDIQKYAEASGDVNPIHLDPAYARHTRFGEPIAHGILAAGTVLSAAGMNLAPDCVVIYVSQNIRYIAPVKAGDTLTATVTATNVDTMKSRVGLECSVKNQKGAEVLAGEAEVQVELTM